MGNIYNLLLTEVNSNEMHGGHSDRYSFRRHLFQQVENIEENAGVEKQKPCLFKTDWT